MTAVHRLTIVDDVKRSPARTRIMHLAEGVLVGLLNTAPENSLRELIGAAQSAGLSPDAVAFALVAVSSGQRSLHSDDPATVTVRHHWGTELSRFAAITPIEKSA